MSASCLINLKDSKTHFFNGLRSSSQHNNVVPTADNSIACESISEKLLDVTRIAENLDRAIKETQNDLELHNTDSSETDGDSQVESTGHRLGGVNTSDVSILKINIFYF